nr:uncharacterized protein LOC124816318 [Hydra vulgaris]
MYFGYKSTISGFMLFKPNKAYETIDKNISEATVHKLSQHLWYLYNEVAALSIFDNDVDKGDKINMVENFDSDIISSYGKRYIPSKEELCGSLLPCILYGNFFLTSNKYYNGDIISTYFEVSNINECGNYCVRSPTCVFANFNAIQKTCRLMSSAANFSNSVTDSQWQVLTTDDSSMKNLGPLCESNTPCTTLYCRDVCLTDDQDLVHSYTCFDKTDISKDALPSLSSIYGQGTEPIKAIDSDKTTAAITHNGGQNWFQLDLKYIYQMRKIVIWNNSDDPTKISGNILSGSIINKLSNFIKIATLNSNEQQTYLTSIAARYLRIVKQNSVQLHLGEISVYV